MCALRDMPVSVCERDGGCSTEPCVIVSYNGATHQLVLQTAGQESSGHWGN